MTQNEWTPERLESVRQTALAILTRSKADEEFKNQIIHDPVKTLMEAGLPREAVGNFLRDSQLGELNEDVDGYHVVCAGTVVVGG